MEILFDMPPWLFVTSALVFGLVVGSFLNVVIHRLPIMLERGWTLELAELAEQRGTPLNLPKELNETYNLAKPDSACPHCGHKITALENIPILSWLVLGGKCSNCSAPISVRYPAVELLTGLATAFVAWRLGPSWEALAGILFTWYLIPLAAIDIDHQILPDIMTLPLLWIGLTLSLFSPQPAQMLFVAPTTAIVGALAGYLSLWSIYQAFRLLTGKEGMGYGDFKLLAALGAWLGWQVLPMLVLLAAATGTVFAVVQMLLRRQERGQPMPFGQWLAAAGWIILVGGQSLQTAYQRLLGL
ncbi:MAG: A24 family peptidase [Pseudomonadota bacterium]